MSLRLGRLSLPSLAVQPFVLDREPRVLNTTRFAISGGSEPVSAQGSLILTLRKKGLRLYEDRAHAHAHVQGPR